MGTNKDINASANSDTKTELQYIRQGDVLYSLCNSNMNIQQWRFFIIHLARIDLQKINPSAIDYSLDEFQKIMEIENTRYVKDGKISGHENTALKTKEMLNSLLQITITIEYPDETKEKISLYNGKNINSITLLQGIGDFFKLSFSKNFTDKIKINDFQKWFFKFDLWQAIELRKKYHINLFIFFNEFFHIHIADNGEQNLKYLFSVIGLPETSTYRRWDNFKSKLLKQALETIEEVTGKKIKHEIATKSGKGGEVESLRFSSPDFKQNSTANFENYLTDNDKKNIESFISKWNSRYSPLPEYAHSWNLDNEDDRYYYEFTVSEYYHELEENGADVYMVWDRSTEAKIKINNFGEIVDGVYTDIEIGRPGFPLTLRMYDADTEKYEDIIIRKRDDSSEKQKIIERKAKIEYLMYACNDEFTFEQVEDFVRLMTEYFNQEVLSNKNITKYYAHLKKCYLRLDSYRKDIAELENPYRYMKTLLFDKE